MATWFEARACSRSSATTLAGGACTQAALALAKLCYHTLLEEGEKAMLAAEQQVVTPALERVIEANTYLSGVGFESGGLAAAHAVHNGLTAIAAPPLLPWREGRIRHLNAIGAGKCPA